MDKLIASLKAHEFKELEDAEAAVTRNLDRFKQIEKIANAILDDRGTEYGSPEYRLASTICCTAGQGRAAAEWTQTSIPRRWANLCKDWSETPVDDDADL